MTDANTKIWRVLIADDEAPSRSIIRESLAQEPDVTIVGEAADGYDALKLADANRPDIVFLDIQMPKLTGVEVLELLDPRIAVVFVTAYDHYAVQTFELQAVDYLRKPFTQARLKDALGRAQAKVGNPRAIPPQGLREDFCERIAVCDGSRVHLIAVQDLDYAAAEGDYVALHSSGRCYLKQQTMQSLEDTLDPRVFVRIHRSALLNITRLARIEAVNKDSKVAFLKDGTQLPISRAGQARLAELLA